MKLHDYQEYAVKFIEEHKIAALLLDMGLGKTITIKCPLCQDKKQKIYRDV